MFTVILLASHDKLILLLHCYSQTPNENIFVMELASKCIHHWPDLLKL